jgi:hypothetical protein
LQIEIIKGSELPPEPIDFMNAQRIKEYGRNSKDFEKNENESIFFFLKENDLIKAFGMLKPVELIHKNKSYSVLGLGNVIAVEKGRGYGSKLMKEINNYLVKNKIPAFANTHKDNFEFYRKNGYKVEKSLLERIVEKSEKHKDYDWSEYSMIYFDPTHQLEELVNGEGDVIIDALF